MFEACEVVSLSFFSEPFRPPRGQKDPFDPTHFCWDPAIWCGEKKREKNWLSSGAFMRPQKDFPKLLSTMGFITIKQTTIWENIFGTFFQASKSRKIQVSSFRLCLTISLP